MQAPRPEELKSVWGSFEVDVTIVTLGTLRNRNGIAASACAHKNVCSGSWGLAVEDLTQLPRHRRSMPLPGQAII